MARNDGSVGYELLESQATIIYKSQQFIIKQIVPQFSGGVEQKQITAIHVMYDCSKIRQTGTKTGTLTYTPQSIMDYVFTGNSLGFTYEIIGSFESRQLTDFGNVSGQEALSKIIENWPNAIVDADNRHIKIYTRDKYMTNVGHRLDYQNNSSEVKFTYDSTNITNKVLCIGKAYDKQNDSDPTTFYFEPFFVTIDDSIEKYGECYLANISDDRFTDSQSIREYALSKLTPEPTLAIEVTTMINEPATLGDKVRLEVRQDNLVTYVETVAYQYYPFDDSQPTQITLNNTEKTILDYQNNIASRIGRANEENKTRINGLTLDLGKLDLRTTEQLKKITETVTESNDKVTSQNQKIAAVETVNQTNSTAITELKDGVTSYQAQVTDVVKELKSNADEIKAKASNADLKLVKNDVTEVASAASSASNLATIGKSEAENAQSTADSANSTAQQALTISENNKNQLADKVNQASWTSLTSSISDKEKSTNEQIKILSDSVGAFNLDLNQKAKQSDLDNYATKDEIKELSKGRIFYEEV